MTSLTYYFYFVNVMNLVTFVFVSLKKSDYSGMYSRYSLLNVFTGFRRESQFYMAKENISFIFGVVDGGVGLSK